METITLVKARKLGGSIVVRIPREIVEQKSIIPGETVGISIKKIKKSWFGAFKGLKPFTKEDEFDA